ncbi:lipase ZK262.3-like [Watersipora subatra]|uniref:lipase ZK262.3-like n=1 Tax=Watersipora subatra TaxID=2589382 RepID=UPI00355C5286
MTSCQECVTKETWAKVTNCRWCPFDQRCHTVGALVTNPCSSEIHIKHESDCPDRPPVHGSYDEQEAYQQLLLSTVAYADEPVKCWTNINRIRSDVDFELDLVSFIANKCEGQFFDYKECAVLVALSHSNRAIFVSFRGTYELTQFIEQSLSTLFKPKLKLGDGHVQEYFLDAYSKLSPCLSSKMEYLMSQYPNYTVKFSGHSLGGALASIAAFKFIQEGRLSKDEVTLYTYGMPRVGDKLYAAEHDRRVDSSFRLVNYKDCIPHFPMCRVSCSAQGETGPYHHRTEVFYDTSDMQLESNYTICQSNEDVDCSHKYQGPTATFWHINSCIHHHQTYFGIRVGEYCNQLFGESPNMSSIIDIRSADGCYILNI